MFFRIWNLSISQVFCSKITREMPMRCLVFISMTLWFHGFSLSGFLRDKFLRISRIWFKIWKEDMEESIIRFSSGRSRDVQKCNDASNFWGGFFREFLPKCIRKMHTSIHYWKFRFFHNLRSWGRIAKCFANFISFAAAVQQLLQWATVWQTFDFLDI